MAIKALDFADRCRESAIGDIKREIVDIMTEKESAFVNVIIDKHISEKED